MTDEGQQFKRAADGLCEVTLAIENVDYNCLMESELLTLLEAHQAIREICLRCRHDQRAVERREDDDG